MKSLLFGGLRYKLGAIGPCAAQRKKSVPRVTRRESQQSDSTRVSGSAFDSITSVASRSFKEIRSLLEFPCIPLSQGDRNTACRARRRHEIQVAGGLFGDA